MPDHKTRDRLGPSAQHTGMMYEMSIRFKAHAQSKQLNELLDGTGFHEKPTAMDAVVTRIVQTVPFIPDDETLAKYAQVIQNGKNASDSDVLLAGNKFDGYDYIYAVGLTSDVPRAAAGCVSGLKHLCGLGLMDCPDGCAGCPVRAAIDAIIKTITGKEEEP